MNRTLPDGYRLHHGDGYYEIKSIISAGASCVVYKTFFTNTSDAINGIPKILKECNPRRLNLSRDKNGAIRPSEDQVEIFESNKDRFRDASMLQLEFRKAASTQNVTSNIEAVFDANGTVYTVMTYLTGNTLDQTTSDDLSTFLERLIAIAQVIERYHKKGYLHLDIKPQNIFTIPETPAYVILFDFDSLVLESEVKNRIPLSYTEEFAAPEQRMPNRRSQICKATDLYAIGEILFHRLIGRHSTALEHTGFCDFASSFDLQKPIFKNVTCTTLDALSEILNHTLCSNPKSRYKTAAELIDAIDAVISKPYLIQNLPDIAAFFPGRDDELTAVDQLLNENGYVFVTGLGGIGKSELCKQYAHAHKDEYDAVVFAICDSSLRAMILDDKNIRMGNFAGRFYGDSDDEYLERKLGTLTDACNKRILLIIDNLNSMRDPMLPNLLALNCKKLITTRCNTDANVASYSVGPVENARKIFDHYYQDSLSDEDDKAVDRILAMYDNHTLLVELVAKQMRCSDLFPSEMLKLLVDGGLQNSGTETVEQFKDNGITEFSLHQHILGLFNIANLSTDQVSILVNLSLLPPSGIERRLFKEWCRLSVSEDINALIRSGWIQENKQSRSISLHPVIADIMRDKLIEDFSLCDSMLGEMTLCLKNFENLQIDKQTELLHMVSYTCHRRLIIWRNIYGQDYDDAVSVYIGLGIKWYSLNCLREAKLFFNFALEICGKKYGEDEINADTADLYCKLGVVHYYLGDTDNAYIYCKKALAAHLDIYGSVHKETATCYSNLAMVSEEMGDYINAEEYYTLAYNIRQLLFGDEDTLSLNIKDRLDNLLSKRSGRQAHY